MAVFSKPWTPISTILERIILGIPKKEISKETDWTQSIEGSW
jgi:hypothetical protein